MKTQQLLTGTFTTKDGYLVWRQAWKLVYKQLSDDIRVLKLVEKDHVRNPIAGWDEKTKSWTRFRAWTDVEAKRQEQYAAIVQRSRDEHGNSRPTSRDLAAIATMLLARRKWSKEEAQRQYLAAKAVAA